MVLSMEIPKIETFMRLDDEQLQRLRDFLVQPQLPATRRQRVSWWFGERAYRVRMAWKVLRGRADVSSDW